MGFFGKKEKIPDGIRIMFYEGELREFSTNSPCQILLLDDVLRITKVKPYVEVRLERSRILNIEIFMEESEYMAKYKGVNITTSKAKGISKHYYVIRYLDKNGQERHLDFWGTAGETSKVMKMNKELVSVTRATTYEI